MSIDYILTALIVVLIPGTGVIYTISTGLLKGSGPSIAASIGCTFGIVPHILASTLGLAALLHTSAMAFEFVKYAGIAYLLYLAYSMWTAKGGFDLSRDSTDKSQLRITIHGFLINILNPKLSIFFLAFLPQFISPDTTSALGEMIMLGAVFMGITLIVFILYGLGAAWMRAHILTKPAIQTRLQKVFSLTFIALSLKLALEDR